MEQQKLYEIDQPKQSIGQTCQHVGHPLGSQRATDASGRHIGRLTDANKWPVEPRLKNYIHWHANNVCIGAR